MPKSSSASRSSPRQLQNSIFTIVPSQERPSQLAQTSLKQSSPCQRQSRVRSTRAAHVLHVSTSMNNDPSPLELQCFKTSVSHQVIHSQSIMAKRQSYHHVSQLTTSTICNYTFYIVLHKSHSPPHQRGYSANPQQHGSRNNTTLPNPRSSRNQKDTGSYQCCCMDQGRNWCRHKILAYFHTKPDYILLHNCNFYLELQYIIITCSL